MLIVLAGIVVEMAGGDFGVEFLQNPVIPLKRSPVPPAARRSAVITEAAVAFHQIGMSGIIADAEVRGTEVMDRVEQFLRRVVGKPDVFDGDGDAELLRDRQELRQRGEHGVMELLKGVPFPFGHGVAGMNGNAVDAEFRRDAEGEFQPVKHDAAQAGIGNIEILERSEGSVCVDKGQSGPGDLFFQLFFQVLILHALADEHIGEHQMAGAVGGELGHDVGTHFLRAEFEVEEIGDRNRIHDENLFNFRLEIISVNIPRFPGNASRG